MKMQMGRWGDGDAYGLREGREIDGEVRESGLFKNKIKSEGLLRFHFIPFGIVGEFRHA